MYNSTFVYVTYIATTPEKLWDALTNGEITINYLFGSQIHSDWEEGSSITILQPNGKIDIQGRVLKNKPLQFLSYTYEVPEENTPRERPTIVTFEMQQIETNIKLTFKHENLLKTDYIDTPDTFEGVNNGWPAILSNLKSLLETGHTLQLTIR